jgi:DNA-binding NtrC family response regulator
MKRRSLAPEPSAAPARLRRRRNLEQVAGRALESSSGKGIRASRGDLVTNKQFRKDLYYRRLEDIPVLIAHFVHKYAGRMSKQIS